MAQMHIDAAKQILHFPFLEFGGFFMGISVYTSQLLKNYKRKAGEVKALRKDMREIAKIVLKSRRT